MPSSIRPREEHPVDRPDRPREAQTRGAPARPRWSCSPSEPCSPSAPWAAAAACTRSVAVEAGDQSISDAEVDQLAQDVCTALQAQPEAIGDGYARSTLLQSVVQSFVMRAMADQMADDYGVSATDGYDEVVEQTKLSSPGSTPTFATGSWTRGPQPSTSSTS